MSRSRVNRNYMNILCVLCAFTFGYIFSALMISESCHENYADTIDDHDYLMVVLVLSAPQNIERRNAIRETWFSLRPTQLNDSFYSNNLVYIPPVQTDGFLKFEDVETQQQLLNNYKIWLTKSKANIKVANLRIKHFFAIGTESLDEKIKNDLRVEQNVYSDLLLMRDLADSYNNLTLKVIKSFEKVVKTTLNFKYLLKCDDDTYAKLDLVAQDLIHYDRKLRSSSQDSEESVQPTSTNKNRNNLELYWGYFHGRARIQKTGHWNEKNFHLCDRYLPYALGGGYVLSKNLVRYIADHGKVLGTFVSEDISVGTWLSPFKHIHKRHDPRFDTNYMPRECRNYHIVLHKKTVNDMHQVHKGNHCFNELKYDISIKKPVEYFYDWKQSPLKCCDSRVLE